MKGRMVAAFEPLLVYCVGGMLDSACVVICMEAAEV